MEASFAQIHRHFSSRNLLRDRNRSNIKPFVRYLSYGRRKSFRLSVSMHPDGTNMESPGREAKTATSFTTDIPKQHMETAEKSYPSSDQVNGNLGNDASGRLDGVVQPKKSAKIHDFCFGIPFGGLVLSGGFVSFLFSRNPATLTSGVLYGGALLALSSYSLKVWRQGKSSLPFILGQAALAAALLWKHLQMYTLTKKLFPTGFLTVVSAAMLCFYTYVMMSGGNPPPKKLKLATNSPS